MLTLAAIEPGSDGSSSRVDKLKLSPPTTQVKPGSSTESTVQAFRLQSDGEWYQPLNNIDEITKEGAAVNGQLFFQIPEDSGVVLLEGGMPLGSEDGTTTRFEISF